MLKLVSTALKLRTTCYSAVRFCSAMKETKLYPQLSTKLPRKGPHNPFLELSKPKAERQSLAKGVIDQTVFDKRFMVYPQTLDETRADSIEKLYTSVKAFVNSLDPDCLKDEFPPELRKQLSSFGAFSALIPKELGGLGMTNTEFMRFLEAFGENLALATIVLTHNCTVSSLILPFATQEFKSKYLSRLASGESIAAYALTEKTGGSDWVRSRTKAHHMLSEKNIRIRGEKLFVTNGQFADVIVTLCKYLELSSEFDDSTEDRLELIIVERSSPGVKVNKSTAFKGLQNIGLASICFDDLSVPESNSLNVSGDIVEKLNSLHQSLRYSVAASVLGSMKLVFQEFTAKAQALNKTLGSSRNSRTEEELVEFAAEIYGIESALYMNAAIMDGVEDPDVNIDNAIVYWASMESAVLLIDRLANLFGSQALEKNNIISSLQRDINCLTDICNGGYLSRLITSMLIIQFFGANQNLKIQIRRDPLVFMKESLNMLCRELFCKQDSVDKECSFSDSVHPSLESRAKALGYYHRRTTSVIERAICDYGARILECQIMLEGLTGIICDNYLMTTALARLSRTKANGFPNYELEACLYDALVKRKSKRIEDATASDHLFDSAIVEQQVGVIEKLINEGNYAIQHPLTRCF